MGLITLCIVLVEIKNNLLLGFHINVTISCQKNEFPSRRTSELVGARSQNILKITKKLFVMFAHPMIQYDQLPAVAIKFRLF